jgi:hypothetical protein
MRERRGLKGIEGVGPGGGSPTERERECGRKEE